MICKTNKSNFNTYSMINHKVTFCFKDIFAHHGKYLTGLFVKCVNTFQMEFPALVQCTPSFIADIQVQGKYLNYVEDRGRSFSFSENVLRG